MGQLLVSRCALYLGSGDELVLAQERGMRMDEDARSLPLAEAAAARRRCTVPTPSPTWRRAACATR